MRRFPVNFFMGFVCAWLLFGCSETGKQESTSLAADYRPDYRRGLYVYSAFCSECHDTGKNGAPLLDDSEAWEERGVGFPALLQRHASQGFLAMPEKGAHSELTEQNIADAVHYMIRQIASEEE